MLYTITLRAPRSAQTYRALLRQAARATLQNQSVLEASELTIVITSDEALHRLNLQHLGEDHPTDVLSFPSDEFDLENGRRYWGDLAISLARAQAQAAAGGHPVSAELQLLVVHGTLHLLGHDHAKKRDKARMWAAQGEILKGLGVAIIIPD